ncbi:type IV secretory system conjugative DNA transfer family protein [Mycolicibacterium sphagni]|uniref:Type IV secretory system conjugative DNA transfer family protein n=1 Tax=Mycolicibacterium sphagni TaxID=1786 RepID=A0ABX2K3C9_9MYCO|nr:type IV secretory system conjugative DNA transfer family protein [Mycolicibacterium sphagni]NTY62579.1 type IV secretory system conjugative DNA transfer family protein [Mycolicibacterium sphagni]
MYKEPQTPYCGFMRRQVNGREQLYVPRTAPHCLISAPTETGKTRRLLAPAISLWGGPALVVNSKDDILDLVMQCRLGPTAVIDFRPIANPTYPAGVVPMTYDPTTTIETPLEALTIAENIMQMATVGMGSGADQVSDGGVWESQASGPLAAFLYAASPNGNGMGMDWVLKAVDNMDTTETGATQPGWLQAAALCHQYEVLAIGMTKILNMEARQRDSVAITMRKAITPWLRMSLNIAMGHDVPWTFDPSFLDHPQATVFILAPADGTVAGAAVTMIEALYRRWREKTARREQMHRLLIAIDELPNTAPLPSLRRIIGEGRGLGVNVLACVQNSTQLDTVYGPIYANELRKIFPANIIMFGADEDELLMGPESWSGLTFRRSEGFGQADGHRNLNSDFGAGLRWQELLPPDYEHARLILRGGLGHCVEIPDWSRFRVLYDRASAAALQRAGRAPLVPSAAAGPGREVNRMRRLRHFIVGE